MQRLTEDKFVSDINENIGIIHKICNVYFTGEHDRQDARQEILYQLWKSYATYRGDSRFSTWMYKVALNTAIVHLKKNKKQPVNTMLPKEFAHLAENSDQSPAHEKMSVLYTAINTLSEIDKAITLLFLEDNSYEEISMITGISKSAVSVRLVRIRKTLKEKIQNII